ncbi:hypothetical protein [Phycicoccus sonneratiae]|uniref:Lipoprotein n=1 Tax=Phycicoccus sonneratiae TaxID=2807628 RepID=A0ABS2CQX6_9MICO|nr:hypothetical protein [Phycicoccus sonneraticus]MBM6402287.1 hypothetical protein [Phycicoccus sonneraticus]
MGIAAVAVLAAVALAGCNDGDATPTVSSATQTATATSASSSSTPTPTKSLTPAEQDLVDAEQSVIDYWRVLDSTGADPKSNLNVLATVARGQALAQWQSTLSDYRSKGWVQQGAAKVVDPAAAKKANKKFSVTACIDVTGVEVVDASGKSVVASSRPNRQQYTYEVEKSPQGFFVTVDRLEGRPCVA